ncbi:dienelactone hydrolase family protein [Stappia sp. ES.058]|uniref:dienelactone hydrolase family protein n=1 Tax=Stappia sp. ES.058 TaxID=1881061 RepID=UPI00087D8840|nr:dienelactone hydrolase family protein [Stappia sp. ES.058]SDU18881.1 Dienelactone hydrolase [Stappia sp. ES.058]
MRRWLVWTGVALALVAMLLAVNGFRGRLGWTANPQSPQAIATLIATAMRWTLPKEEGPHPVALLLSGCDGPRTNLDRLAVELASAGWASVIVDSHGPRGLEEAQLWRLVCAGQLLNGAERAADIAVTLAALRDRPEIDSTRIVLIGVSHGGWTSLDYLAMARAGTLPPLLTSWPEAITDDPLAGIKGAVLYYPYCGPASLGSANALPPDLSYLFLLVEGDAIANERHCLELAGRLVSMKANVAVTVYEGVTHGFDVPEKSFLSPLEFDAETTDAAIAATLDFLGPP